MEGESENSINFLHHWEMIQAQSDSSVFFFLLFCFLFFLAFFL